MADGGAFFARSNRAHTLIEADRRQRNCSLCCSRQGGRVAIHIPYARKPNFLRARARRLREIASTAQTILSDQLRMMAEELETHADELERAYPSSNDGS